MHSWSSTVLVKNPVAFKISGMQGLAKAWPANGKRPLVGLSPTIPQLCAGFLILPPESDPEMTNSTYNLWKKISLEIYWIGSKLFGYIFR